MKTVASVKGQLFGQVLDFHNEYVSDVEGLEGVNVFVKSVMDDTLGELCRVSNTFELWVGYSKTDKSITTLAPLNKDSINKDMPEHGHQLIRGLRDWQQDVGDPVAKQAIGELIRECVADNEKFLALA